MTSALSGKTALVTGASRGIGYATAMALAAEGAHVIAVARTVGGLEELDDAIKQGPGSATLVPLDLLDFAAIDQLGAALNDRFGKIDILVANAAILGANLSPANHVDPKVFDKVISTNVTANWRLIRSMDPLLRAAQNAIVVGLGDEMVAEPKPFWSTYLQSKAAFEEMVRIYGLENEKLGITTHIYRPGPTRTALRALAMPGEDTSALREPVDAARDITEIVTSHFKAN